MVLLKIDWIFYISYKENKETLTKNILFICGGTFVGLADIIQKRIKKDDIKIKILPRSVVNSANFTPVPLKYYKEEHSYEDYSQIRYIDFE